MACLIFILAIAAAHGWSLSDGLFLDDHWHVREYAAGDYSWSGLLDAATIDPERFMDSWWQEKPTRWTYTRPVSILVPQAIYQLTGGSVRALHATSLLLHLAGTWLVFLLCWRLTRRWGWSLVGGLLFVVYSHSIFAVGWLAAQNTVLQTVLMLAALHCYIRASSLELFPYNKKEPQPSQVPRLKWGWLAATIGLWILAVLSRENALMLPPILVGFDLAFGGRRQVWRRWPAYLPFMLLGGAFLYWRLFVYYEPMPDFYFRKPGGEGYLLWWLIKLLHYVTAVIWLSPMTVGPTGRYNPLAEVPGDCLLMLLIVVVLAGGYIWACRKARGWWLWPMWILLGVLPVVPVLATPHSGYLPAVGFAVAMILGPALHPYLKPRARFFVSRYVAIWFLIATTTYMPIYRNLWAAINAGEDLTIARMVQQPPSPAVRDIYLINIPFVNIYSRYQLESEMDCLGLAHADDFHCHVLTYAPSDVVRMEEPCRLTQQDGHRFTIEVRGRPWFSGALGRFLIEGMRTSGPFRQGQVIDGTDFDVHILHADEQGVSKLLFDFHRPLSDPGMCFYLATRDRAAGKIEFVQAPLDSPLVLYDDMDAPGQNDAPSDEKWAGKQDPWFVPSAHAEGENACEIALLPGEQRCRQLRDTRDSLFRTIDITRSIIETDLYLTGPPYDDPRGNWPPD